MLTNDKNHRSMKPYLILGFGLAYLAHRLVKLFEAAPPSSDPYDVFGLSRLDWVFQQLPWKLLGWDIAFSPASAGVFGLVLFAVLLAYLRVDRQETYRYGEEHGSARYAQYEELRRFEDEDPDMNLINSQRARMGIDNRRLDYKNHLNKNGFYIGPPGEGKTRTIIKPNILQMSGSFILTDPKGLVIHETGYALEMSGYKIKIFDLVNLINSNQFNAFRYVASELDIDRMAEALVSGTSKSDNKGEDFWVQAEALLIRSLLAFLYFDGPLRGYEPSVPLVSDMLRYLKREDPDVKSPVEYMFEELEEDLPHNYACKQFKLFMGNFSGQTLMSVLAVASSRFSVFDHDEVRRLVATDTMEIERWQLEKTAVFIAIPETDPTYNFLANLLFTTAMRVLPKVADGILQGKNEKISAKELLHFRYWLDEFAQIGKIPSFTEALSSMRSREQSAGIIVQAKGQVEHLYGENQADTIINNCATMVYLGTNDKKTMEYFSMRAGKQTITQRSQSKTYSYHNGSSSESEQHQGRDLLTPDEITKIPLDETLVYYSRQNVFRDKKFVLESHPRAHLLADKPSDAYWYTYQRFMTEYDEWETMIASEHQVGLTQAGLEPISWQQTAFRLQQEKER